MLRDELSKRYSQSIRDKANHNGFEKISKLLFEAVNNSEDCVIFEYEELSDAIIYKLRDEGLEVERLASSGMWRVRGWNYIPDKSIYENSKDNGISNHEKDVASTIGILLAELLLGDSTSKYYNPPFKEFHNQPNGAMDANYIANLKTNGDAVIQPNTY